jgi:uncharacterized membrane protein YdjX (TVP38/TMEM64 family)
MMKRVVNQEGLRVMLLARLSPVLPFSFLNLAYGLSDIPPMKFAIGLIGIIPGVMLYVGFGSAVAGSKSGSGILSLIGLVATLICAALLARRLVSSSKRV